MTPKELQLSLLILGFKKVRIDPLPIFIHKESIVYFCETLVKYTVKDDMLLIANNCNMEKVLEAILQEIDNV